MDEVADLCNSRYSEILDEPYGGVLISLPSWPLHPPIRSDVELGDERIGGGAGAVRRGNAARAGDNSHDVILEATDAACLLPLPVAAIIAGGAWSVVSPSSIY
jgi:hypothetical protein